MKLVLAALCLFALTSTAALAADTSPRARCLLGAEKQEQSVRKRLDLLLSARRPALHRSQTLRVQTQAVGDASSTTTTYTTTSIALPSEISIMQRELRRVAWRKNYCEGLSNVEQTRAERLSIGRGAAWKPGGR